MDANKFWAQSENKTWSAMREYHCKKVRGAFLGTFEDYIYMLKDPDLSLPKLEVGDLILTPAWANGLCIEDRHLIHYEGDEGVEEVWREVVPPDFIRDATSVNIKYNSTERWIATNHLTLDEIKIFRRIYKRGE